MTNSRSLVRRAASYLIDAARGIRSAPIEVIATLFIASTFSVALETGGDAMRYWTELAVACVLLIAAAWTGTLLHALGSWHATRRWAVTVGGAVIIAVYALAIADFEYEAEGWRALVLVGAAVLWLFALPAFGGSREGAVERMRRIDGRILLRMIGALLYGVALFAGLALALRAIAVLFELELHNEIYGHVWGWIFFALVPWIVLGGLRDYVLPLDEANQVAGVAHRLALYLVPPLLALYGLILYAYVIRIMVTGEIPKNLLSPMVVAAGALAALALLLFDPRPGDGPLARWLRAAPVLFLPLAPLGVWALLMRTHQYGWTEFRGLRIVLLAALGALAIGATLQVMRRRPFLLHAAPAALAGALLLSAIGPWSVVAVARQSQQMLLGNALERAGVPARDSAYHAPGSQDSARVIDASAYEQIRGSAQYLVQHHGADAVPPVLRRLARREDGQWLDYPAQLGLRPDDVDAARLTGMGGTLPLGVPLPVSGGTAYRIEWASPEPGAGRSPVAQPPAQAPRSSNARSDARNGVTSVMLQGATVLVIRIGASVLHAELAPLIGSLQTIGRPRRDEGILPPGQAVLTVTDSAGVARGELVLWHLWAEQDSAGVRMRRAEGLLVIRGGSH